MRAAAIPFALFILAAACTQSTIAVPGLPPPPASVLAAQKSMQVPPGITRDGDGRLWCARDGAEMVLVPGGDFAMGSDLDLEDEGEKDSHKPEHLVHVSPFLIDRHVVTFGQFRKFALAARGREPAYLADDLLGPMNNQSWEDASAYARWAGKRLPTEAEWEKAARGTDRRKYPWGNEGGPVKVEMGWGPMWRMPEGRGVPVEGTGLRHPGSDPSNAGPYGCFDMLGVLPEWCADWYDPKYYGTSPRRDPPGPAKGGLRTFRGEGSTVFRRGSSDPGKGGSGCVFRTVMSVPGSGAVPESR
jgi:sulfatase modifying factor 1